MRETHLRWLWVGPGPTLLRRAALLAVMALAPERVSVANVQIFARAYGLQHHRDRHRCGQRRVVDPGVVALTRFAGHCDYAACAAVCWLMLASYSTGVR